LSRKVKGSNRRRRAAREVARIHAKVADSRLEQVIYMPEHSLSIKIDASSVKVFAARIAGTLLRIPQITSYALINTAEQVAARLREEAKNVFDRPTPQVITSIQPEISSDKRSAGVRIRAPSTTAHFAGSITHDGVTYDDPISVALVPQIFGGPRAEKGMEGWLRHAQLIGPDEWLIPSKYAQLDAYGNIPGPVAAKIISDLRGYNIAGFEANTKKAKKDYILGKIGKRAVIFNIAGGRHVPVFIVTRKPSYNERFDFFGIGTSEAEKIFRLEWPRVFEREAAKGALVGGS